MYAMDSCWRDENNRDCICTCVCVLGVKFLLLEGRASFSPWALFCFVWRHTVVRLLFIIIIISFFISIEEDGRSVIRRADYSASAHRPWSLPQRRSSLIRKKSFDISRRLLKNSSQCFDISLNGPSSPTLSRGLVQFVSYWWPAPVVVEQVRKRGGWK